MITYLIGDVVSTPDDHIGIIVAVAKSTCTVKMMVTGKEQSYDPRKLTPKGVAVDRQFITEFLGLE